MIGGKDTSKADQDEWPFVLISSPPKETETNLNECSANTRHGVTSA